MEAGRSFDDNEAWRELTTIIELSRRRLRFVLVECEDEAVRTRLCKHLHGYCMWEHRLFFAPPPSAPKGGIEWLSHQQQRAAETPAAERPPVLFFPLPEGEEEIFCLYRLNENRDNLRRDLRGVLVLAGLKGFRSRVPNHAPDLWSMREKSLELSRADLAALDLAREHAHEAASSAAPFEASLSFAHRDHEAAADLCSRLHVDGIPCAHLDHTGAMAPDLFASGRLLLVLLSPDWVNTHAEAFAEEIEKAGGIEAVRGRIVPLMVRDCVPPGDLRGYTPIPWKTEAEREKWYPKLRKMLQFRWFKLHEQA